MHSVGYKRTNAARQKNRGEPPDLIGTRLFCAPSFLGMRMVQEVTYLSHVGVSILKARTIWPMDRD